MVGRTVTIGTVSGSLGYAYDAADRLVQITYPSGRTVGYTRNVLGQVTEVTTTSEDGLTTEVLASDITYAPFGPLEGLTYGNGIALTRDHDLDYRLTSQVAGTVQQLDYSYDASDNVTAVTDGLDPNRNQTLGYDALDRLTSASGAYGSLGYGYDALGNRLTKSGPGGSESYDYAADSNRLLQYTTGSGSYAVSYDANGNLSGDGYWGFSYGDHNRMTEARAQGSVVGTYRYNGLGQRVSKDNGQVKDQETLFVYDEAGRLIGEYDAQGFPLRETVWLDGVPLAVVADDVVHFVHTDRLGTPRAITTGAGSVIWRWDPEPFGDSAPDQDPDGDGVNAVYHARFPGQYFDVETTLHYNYFRDYVPEFGRYLESDPIGLSGGLNTYSYIDGNPLSAIDPFGNIKWEASVVGGGFGAVIGGMYLYIKFLSECIDGLRAEVDIHALGAGVGAGWKGAAAGITMEFEDFDIAVDPRNLVGPFRMMAAGATVSPVPEMFLGGPGVGGSAGWMQVGGAFSTPGVSLTLGMDLSALAVRGRSWMSGKPKFETCDCESQE